VAETDLLTARLADAGFEVAAVESVTGGAVADAGLVTLADGRRVFAKTLRPDVVGVFEVEAEGLRALGSTGSVETPRVLAVDPRLLVLSLLEPRRDDSPGFWAELGAMVATMHITNRHDRYGWHRDGWLGRMRQVNTWTDDGHAFFAEHRLLRWLSEPMVEQALDAEDRRALENLCAELPSIVPGRPAALTHGDLWSGNLMADAAGTPAVIDPAVSYMWPEVDVSTLWCAPRPPASASFFTAYHDVAPLPDGWPDRAPILFLREQLSAIAHGDDAWGAVQYTRDVIAPFRTRRAVI
jgi:fructosamine-3-kinase